MASKPVAENDSDMRMKRGLAIFESGKSIVENEDGSFSVPSQQTHGKSYEVRLLGQTWACTCPDFQYRPVEACKHIFAVRIQIAAKTYLKDEPKPKVFADDAIPCDGCGSIRVIHYGKSGNKQVYFCKDCRRKFRESSLLKKARFTPEFVTLCLDLYFSGLSLRKITRTVGTHFNIDIDHSTIYRWIAKYVPIISEYVNSLAPQLSKTWHADEVYVKMKEGDLMYGNKHTGFVWNIMDRETRFLIVSKLTAHRGIDDAVSAFREAAANAHGIVPETVFTDSLRHYGGSMKATFPDAKRIENCGLRKKNANNNRIERMNGTLRERVKVQRGWKIVKTPLADGNRIQYNFVKPHMALDGQTPAQVAGLDVKGWKALLEKAITNRSATTKENNR